jgi:hypothetical protein
MFSLFSRSSADSLFFAIIVVNSSTSSTTSSFRFKGLFFSSFIYGVIKKDCLSW